MLLDFSNCKGTDIFKMITRCAPGICLYLKVFYMYGPWGVTWGGPLIFSNPDWPLQEDKYSLGHRVWELQTNTNSIAIQIRKSTKPTPTPTNQSVLAIKRLLKVHRRHMKGLSSPDTTRYQHCLNSVIIRELVVFPSWWAAAPYAALL